VVEQAVQVSWSLEQMQVKELYYQQVQDVQDQFRKHLTVI
jgi:hypothetical protein